MLQSYLKAKVKQQRVKAKQDRKRLRKEKRNYQLSLMEAFKEAANA